MRPISELVLEYLPARRVLHEPRYRWASVRPGLMCPVEYELGHGEIVGDEWRGLLRVELHRGHRERSSVNSVKPMRKLVILLCFSMIMIMRTSGWPEVKWAELFIVASRLFLTRRSASCKF